MNSADIPALARILDRLDYYKLLRVDSASPLPTIRGAFQKARRDFHPDAFTGEDDALRAAVDAISKRLNEAYLVLRDPAKRKAYDAGLERGRLRYTAESEEETRAAEQASKGTTPNGKRFAAQAAAEERNGGLDAALSNWKMALTFESGNAAFQAKIEALEAKLGQARKAS